MTNDALSNQVGGSHYKGAAIQHVEFCQVNDIPWCEASALKYIIRHRKKNGAQDLQKAIHYLQLAMQIYDRDESTALRLGARHGLVCYRSIDLGDFLKSNEVPMAESTVVHLVFETAGHYLDRYPRAIDLLQQICAMQYGV